MGNYKTGRKQLNIFLSKEAIDVYKELQASGVRAAIVVEEFLIELGKKDQSTHEEEK